MDCVQLVKFSLLAVLATYTAFAVAAEYGPYVLNIRKFEQCRGPRALNLTSYSFILKTDRDGNIVSFDFNSTVTSPVKVEEIKAYVYEYNDGKKKLLVNYKVDKPCTSSSRIATFLNNYVMDAKRPCYLKMGTNNIVIDLKDTVARFFGTSFFYGRYVTKNLVLSSKGNVACITTEIHITPKINKK